MKRLFLTLTILSLLGAYTPTHTALSITATQLAPHAAACACPTTANIKPFSCAQFQSHGIRLPMCEATFTPAQINEYAQEGQQKSYYYQGKNFFKKFIPAAVAGFTANAVYEQSKKSYEEPYATVINPDQLPSISNKNTDNSINNESYSSKIPLLNRYFANDTNTSQQATTTTSKHQRITEKSIVTPVQAHDLRPNDPVRIAATTSTPTKSYRTKTPLFRRILNRSTKQEDTSSIPTISALAISMSDQTSEPGYASTPNSARSSASTIPTLSELEISMSDQNEPTSPQVPSKNPGESYKEYLKRIKSFIQYKGTPSNTPKQGNTPRQTTPLISTPVTGSNYPQPTFEMTQQHATNNTHAPFARTHTAPAHGSPQAKKPTPNPTNHQSFNPSKTTRSSITPKAPTPNTYAPFTRSQTAQQVVQSRYQEPSTRPVEQKRETSSHRNEQAKHKLIKQNQQSNIDRIIQQAQNLLACAPSTTVEMMSRQGTIDGLKRHLPEKNQSLPQPRTPEEKAKMNRFRELISQVEQQLSNSREQYARAATAPH